MNTRMNREQFHIGTYILQPYARSEAHIRDLAACGIDLLFGIDYDLKTLDLLHTYQIGAVVSGIVPGWFGGTGKNAGQLAAQNPLEHYRENAKQFRDHPAIWGIDVGDEPSALDFPQYGKVMALVEQEFPQQFAYLNLYPSYGMLASNSPEQIKQELGTSNYETYLQTYCTETKTDYLSFDHYVYSSNPDRLIHDLQLAAAVCQETGRNLWVVLQVNSHLPEQVQTANRLQFQAYTAMCFGASCISWACYTAGWWYNQVLDSNGQKTQQYTNLKQVNQELRTLAAVYQTYRWVKTAQQNAQSVRTNLDGFLNLQLQNNSRVLISLMEAKSDSRRKALFLCAADDPEDRHPGVAVVRFQTKDSLRLTLHTGTGSQPLSPDDNCWYQVLLPSCSGGLITVD